MDHPLQCRCGTLKGHVRPPEVANRGVCYCRDCQAFAHFLGRADEILDAMGGTDVIPTLPANVTFTQGQEALACMRLTENGLLRWYAACCNTPIGNTPPNFRIPFVGLVHNCLEGGSRSLDDAFGPVRMRVYTKSAKGKVPSNPVGMISGMLRFALTVIRARIDGRYKRTPFFFIDKGIPVVTPKVLSRSERDRLMSAL